MSDGACVDPCARIPNRLPQGLLMGRDSLLEFHAQPLGCVHAWGVARARHCTGKPPKRSFKDNPRQSAFSSRFRDESCAAPSPFLDSRKSGHIHLPPTCVSVRPDTQDKHTACAVAPSLPDTLADCAPQRARSHHRFSTVENRSHRPSRANMRASLGVTGYPR
jgi:hypothetical protein